MRGHTAGIEPEGISQDVDVEIDNPQALPTPFSELERRIMDICVSSTGSHQCEQRRVEKTIVRICVKRHGRRKWQIALEKSSGSRAAISRRLSSHLKRLEAHLFKRDRCNVYFA